MIGMLIGALVWSGISRDRQGRLANLRHTDGMVEFIIQKLEPLEEGQRDSIMEIVRSHGDEIVELRTEVRELQSSLRSELNEVLSEDQQKRLNRFMRSQRNRRGPPGARQPRGDRMGPRGDSLRNGGPGDGHRDRRRGRRPVRDSLSTPSPESSQ